MTQPIQEPSAARAMQGFAYARDQLQRRPRGSAWPPGLVPTARMTRTDVFACPGTGVFRNPFLYDDGFTEVERGELDSLPYWDLVEDPSPAPSEWVVEIYLPGIYAMRHHSLWSGGTFYRVTRVQIGVKQGRPDWAEGRHPLAWSDRAVTDPSQNWLNVFDSVIITQADIDSAGSADRIYPQVAQTSGGDIDVMGEFMFWGPVAFEGDYSSTS